MPSRIEQTHATPEEIDLYFEKYGVVCDTEELTEAQRENIKALEKEFEEFKIHR